MCYFLNSMKNEASTYLTQIHRRCVSSLAQTHLKKPLAQNLFLNSDSDLSVISRLCREKKLKEAIEVLFLQRPLRQTSQILDVLDHSLTCATASIYSSLLQLCLQQRALQEGRRVHNHIKSSGFVPGVFICNRLLDMYSKCDSLVDAQKLFDEMIDTDLCSWNTMIAGYTKMGQLNKARQLFEEMPERDNFSWSSMISGYARNDQPRESLELYREMQRTDNLKSNKFTVSSALAASAALRCLRSGKEIHGHILRTQLDSDDIVWSALSDMYGKCGSIDEARHIFDKMLDQDVVSWTTMIGRYLESGRMKEGFELFSDLLTSGVKPNEYTFAGILTACSSQAAEDVGKQVHANMTRIGFDPSSFAASALVHLYCKCGNIESAQKVFKTMPQPDVVSWTSMIVGYAQNGQPLEAVHYFELLLKSGTRPDSVTFVGVLSACTHAGLVDKGLEYFRTIKEEHGLTYTTDHFACIVDLLGRSGQFKKAEEIINNMPIKPDKFLWASLLGGCRLHGNLRLAKRAAEALFEIEPENAATYVTLANIYATNGMWDEVEKIRMAMDDKGVVKLPGSSKIKIKGKVHEFLVGDEAHPQTEEIHKFMEYLSIRMKEEGNIPETYFLLYDVGEGHKDIDTAG